MMGFGVDIGVGRMDSPNPRVVERTVWIQAAAFNLDEKTVKVQLEGDERQIREFIENLQKALVAQFGNPVISFAPFMEDSSLEIPELMRSSQALVVGQLQKGITVQLDILDTLKNLPDKLADVLEKK